MSCVYPQVSDGGISPWFFISQILAFPIKLLDAANEKTPEKCENHFQNSDADEDRAEPQAVTTVLYDGIVVVMAVHVSLDDTVIWVHGKVGLRRTEPLVRNEVPHGECQTRDHCETQTEVDE